jgi:HEAT repeat protein
VLLALALLAGPSVATAHGPVRRQPETVPPGAPELPPVEPLDPRTIPRPATSSAETSSVLPLGDFARDSPVIADGVVTRTESLDEDRLRVYHVRVDHVGKGTLGDEALVVELRGATKRPGVLEDHTRAVLLLRLAPPLSYLTQQLPPGPTYLALTGGRDGVVRVADDAERTLVVDVLTEGERIGTLTGDAQQVARRALAFRELATMHPRLAADAVVQLRRVEGMTSITDDELATLGKALATVSLPAPTRIGLVRLAGERGWKSALPALRRAASDTPQVLDAILAARAQLGAPPDKSELMPYLSSKDPAIRTAAVRALASLPTPAVGEIGRYATTDPDTNVRVAAIEALGETKQPATISTLTQTFSQNDRAVRQASARALMAVGGPAASDAFANLALHGSDVNAKTYAMLLLVLTTGKDSPAVRRVLASNPSPEVVDVAKHGLKWQHSHQHEAE